MLRQDSRRLSPRSPWSGISERLLRSLSRANTPTAVIAAQNVPQAEEEAEEAQGAVDWPSLDEVYEEVKERIEVQNEQIKTLDTKANFGLAAATLLTAGVTGLGRALGETQRTGEIESWNILGRSITAENLVDWITIASLGAYVVAALGAYFAYKLRTFKVSPNPRRLIDKWIHEDPSETKAALTRSRVQDYEFNETVIETKVKWTNTAMIALVIEAVLLLAIAVVQVLWL